MTKFVFSIAAIAACAVALPAAAEPAGQQMIATVGVGQSDIVNGQMSTGLRQRLTRAVEHVCGSYGDVINGQFQPITQCRRAAWADVDRQLATRGEGVQVAVRGR